MDGGTVRLPRIVGHGRALDMILTGRPVGADEALAMGLANRVVPRGSARREAEALARDLCRFPQICMRADRRSAYEQWGQPLDVALYGEWQIGMEAIRVGETFAGASRFAAGHGRSGSFDDL
jgi:enoyl-CoA hydratase